MKASFTSDAGYVDPVYTILFNHEGLQSRVNADELAVMAAIVEIVT